MPYRNVPQELWGKMDSCVKQVQAKQGLPKERAIAICYASLVEKKSAGWITLEEMAALCPSCADKMRERGLARVNLAHLDLGLAEAEEQAGMYLSRSERVAFNKFTALDGAAPFRIMPLGTWYRDDRVLNITEEVAKAIEANFAQGLPRYDVSVNVEHGGEASQPGRVGKLVRVFYVPQDGLYAEAEFTEVGKQLLADGRYNAVSPEVIWALNEGAEYQDPTTGAWHDNVLVGLALTTTPFFGKDVNAFSAVPKPPERLENMEENKMDETKITAEQFAALQVKAGQVDDLTARLAKAEEAQGRLSADLKAERQLRRLEEFTAVARGFGGLAAKPTDLGAHLLWMHDADETEKKDHYTYFSNLLQAASNALKDSSLFTAIGSGRSEEEGTSPFAARVEQIRKERFGDKSYAEGFTSAWKWVNENERGLARAESLARILG